MRELLEQIRSCRLCEDKLPHSPRPVIVASRTARLIIIGQAPGRRVHESGTPWDDASGATLRDWLQLQASEFYDAKRVAIVPMGFCYPGKGRSGDLPPRPECAPQWHPALMHNMPARKLTLLVGAHAQRWYLQRPPAATLTASVKNFNQFLPAFFPLPHPSPRNRHWLACNPWFATDVLPVLRECINKLMRT